MNPFKMKILGIIRLGHLILTSGVTFLISIASSDDCARGPKPLKCPWESTYK